LDANAVKNVAHLARLALDEDDVPGYADELSSILDMVGRLSEADTAAVTPMAHPLEAVQRLRDDKVTEADQRAAFQNQAPAVEDGVYLVPRVIE
jgi:aspartyl-tRNA(Asn)/glutamyl-tRNA(Gln) amidotransferase subunit C